MISTERTIYLHRMEDGEKVRYKFVLDDTMTILSETREDLVHAQVQAKSSQTKLKVPGVQTETVGGSTVITSVSEETQAAMRFFAGADCWFDGCLGLRTAYDEELAEIGGKGCSACKKGALTRKYLPRVLDAIKTSSN